MRGQCAAAALGVAVLAAPSLAFPGAQAGTVPGAPGARIHEVKPGDTLGALAKRYGVRVAGIVAANQLAGPAVVLTPGQRLVIPAATGARQAARPQPKGPVALGVARPAPPVPRAPDNLVLAVPDFYDAPLGFVWPADGPVTSTFGRRRGGWHRGIDIKGERGAPVQAAAAGVVIASGVEPRYGRVVKLEHEHGFVTIYAHNTENLVEVGDRVRAGQLIATIGKSGRATAHHVHFEIRRDGRAYNPLYLLPLPPLVARIEDLQDTGSDDD